MSIKKNKKDTDISNTQNKNFITVSFNRAIAILSAAVLASLVGGIFAGYTLTRNTTFIAKSNAEAIEQIRAEYTRNDVIEPQLKAICEELKEIKSLIEKIR